MGYNDRIFATIFILAFIVGIIGEVSHPVLDYEYVFIGCLVIAIPFGIFGWRFPIAGPDWLSLSSETTKRLIAACVAIVTAAFFLYGSICYANGALDDSPEQTHIVRIVEKVRKIKARFVSVESWRSPGSVETLRKGCDNWDAIIPNQSSAIVRVHNGAFGLPWLQGYEIKY